VLDKASSLPTAVGYEASLALTSDGRNLRIPVKIAFRKGDYEALAPGASIEDFRAELARGAERGGIDEAVETLKSAAADSMERKRLAEALAATGARRVETQSRLRGAEDSCQDFFSRRAATRRCANGRRREPADAGRQRAGNLDPSCVRSWSSGWKR